MRESITVSEPPEIADGTCWDRELPPKMERRGFEQVETARLKSVTDFFSRARKGRDNISGSDSTDCGTYEVGHP